MCDVHQAFEEWLRTRRFVTTLDIILDGTVQEFAQSQGIAEAHCGAEGLSLTTFSHRAI
jgi:hypothetical protein